MHDTKYMDLFERQMDRGPVPAEIQLAVLRDLGLNVPDHAVEKCIPENGFIPLLEAIGWGSYDYEKNIWTPSSAQIYAFDAEVFSIEDMYLIYLKGLQAISEGELAFSDVVQDNCQVNWNGPEGIVHVHFSLNGTPCQYDAAFQGDWLDTRIRQAINRQLEQMGIEKRFYATDGAQGEIIFFCSEAWARKFEDATLCFMS